MDADPTLSPEAAEQAAAGAAAIADIDVDPDAIPTRDPKPAPKAGAKRKHRKTAGGKTWSPERKRAASERAKREAASRARERAPVTKSSSNELAGELAGILAMPALPSVIAAPTVEQKVFLGNHFLTSAPKTASRLVKVSESSPDLRAKLEAITKVSVTFTLIYCGVTYLAPAVLAIAGMLPTAEAIAAMDSLDQASVEQMMSMIAPDANGSPPQTEGAPAPETPAAEGSPPPAGAVG